MCAPACIRSCVFRVIDQSSLILEILPLLAWVFSRNSDISVRYMGFYQLILNQIQRLLINSGLVSILIIRLTVNIRPQSVLIVLVSDSDYIQTRIFVLALIWLLIGPISLNLNI